MVPHHNRDTLWATAQAAWTLHSRVQRSQNPHCEPAAESWNLKDLPAPPLEACPGSNLMKVMIMEFSPEHQMHIPSGKGSRPSVLLVNRQKGEGMHSHSAGGKEKAAYTEPKSSSDAPEV